MNVCVIVERGCLDEGVLALKEPSTEQVHCGSRSWNLGTKSQPQADPADQADRLTKLIKLTSLTKLTKLTKLTSG